MSYWLQIALIYVTALFQGIVVVMVPAAGALLTNGSFQDLTSGEYGSLFVPMIFGAILASLGGGNVALRKGLKRVFLGGLIANGVAMALFASTNLFLHEHLIDFSLLFSSMLFLGIGFGSTLTILNTYVATFFPGKTSMAMTALHAHLGIGTALAPLILDGFVDVKMWWAAPSFVAMAFGVLFILAVAILENHPPNTHRDTESQKLPPIFWLFVIFTGLYGFCETVFGNWATIFLTENKGFNMQQSSVALSLFWGFMMDLQNLKKRTLSS
jgi:MFS family permease